MANEKTEKNPLEVTGNGMLLINTLRAAGNEHTADEITQILVEAGTAGFVEEGAKPKAKVTGIMNALVKRGITERVVVEGTDEAGKSVTCKLLALTEFGQTGDFFVA